MQNRIVTRCVIKRVDDEYQVQAFDQGNQRFREADYFTDCREDAHNTARAMVNESKGAK